ncbi:hypothetical protein N658DRAFT_491207 [Parathielavia hyrcaniae]|uniref:Uncharacterized protein n=1 Tax=Parathielavia hyrcaniae TaxID=113614 RepID=A0AAN6QD37_9PEZI|nr:hypothetical protein N658DRAFT_491207 [Parathielavia hyrcaniae]
MQASRVTGFGLCQGLSIIALASQWNKAPVSMLISSVEFRLTTIRHTASLLSPSLPLFDASGVGSRVILSRARLC